MRTGNKTASILPLVVAVVLVLSVGYGASKFRAKKNPLDFPQQKTEETLLKPGITPSNGTSYANSNKKPKH